jgi:hypothetical protein
MRDDLMCLFSLQIASLLVVYFPESGLLSETRVSRIPQTGEYSPVSHKTGLMGTHGDDLRQVIHSFLAEK